MKNLKMNNRLKQYAIVFFTTLLLASCSSDDSGGSGPGPGSGSKFKPSDFKISEIVHDNLDDDLFIDYQQTNISSMDYDSDNDGMFRIKWTVKSTDGIQFHTDRLLATELDAGAAASLSCLIELTPGKTVDISTLKYEVYFDQ